MKQTAVGGDRRRARAAATGRMLTLAAVAAAAVGGAAVNASTAAAEEQPWGFEQVTPVDKGGTEVSEYRTAWANADGSVLTYRTLGAMARPDLASAPYNASYLARRTGEAEWPTTALDTAIDPDVQLDTVGSTVAGVSRDGNFALVGSGRVLAPGGVASGLNIYRRDLRRDTYEFVAGNPSPWAFMEFAGFPGTSDGVLMAASDDFDSVMLQTAWPFDEAGGEHEYGRSYFYEWSRASGLRLVSLDPTGSPVVQAQGPMPDGSARNPNFVSADRRQFVFTTSTWPAGPFVGLWARRDGATRPIAYSRIAGDDTRPIEVLPASVGATPDGRHVAFTSFEGPRLTDEDPYPTSDPDARYASRLYLYDREQPEAQQLRFIALYARLIQLSDDGRSLYFASGRALAPNAVENAENIYVWRDGAIRLVAPGGALLQRDPAVLNFSSDGHLASPNGRFFMFASTARLTADNSENLARCATLENNFDHVPGRCMEVYLYDAELDRLNCASCMPAGQPSMGHARSGPQSARAEQFRARPLITDDGTVFFDTPNALSPDDGNGHRDVYAYRAGTRRLLSRGTPNTTSRLITVSADGSVFFSTTDPIVGQDRDRLFDVYVTSPRAGLDAQNPAQAAPSCRGAACAGPSETPPPAAPGTSASIGDGNLPDEDPTLPAPSLSVSYPKTVAGTAAKLRVRVTGAGSIALSGPRVRSVTVRAAKAATYTAKVVLRARAKRTLKRTGRVRATVTLAFGPTAGGTASARVTLIFRQKAGGRKSRKLDRAGRAASLTTTVTGGR